MREGKIREGREERQDLGNTAAIITVVTGTKLYQALSQVLGVDYSIYFSH